MGDHDQPRYPPMPAAHFFCVDCRKEFCYYLGSRDAEDAREQFDHEHTNLHRRMREYVGQSALQR